MLALNNISFEFGGEYLYKNANWHIKPKERIGLVGKNGTGKSTLLRIITEDYELREGSISKLKSLSIGFLNQDMVSYQTRDDILSVAMQAFKKQLKIHKEMDHMLSVVETDYSEENLHKLASLQEEFERLDGYTMQSKAEEILEGLGFTTQDLKRPLDEFSGGWRMRVILARMLLEQPDLLLLDEPTNHLDLPSIEWLEEYLKTYEGTVVIVSHDRYFLNRMVTKIVEVANQQLYVWEGNYNFYLNAKKERDDLQQRQYENQKQYIKDQEKFINRFRAKASKAKAVQSRITLLDKMDRIEQVAEESANMTVNFRVKRPSGKVVMKLEHISKSYGDQEVINNTDLIIARGDKIALIGANGMGKSTMLRIVANAEKFGGVREEGHNVIPAFYAQHQLEALNLSNEILQEMKENSGERTETELRSLLGCFLFSGEDVFKKIKVLSGGEKARVSLAKTLITEANFLLLDEPTNHLDIQSIEILLQALERYEGSFIVVSHDRYFVSKVANKIWYIEDKQVKEYPGTYDEYVQWKNSRDESFQKKEQVKVVKEKKEKPAKGLNGTYNDNEWKQAKKDLNSAQNKLSSLEVKMDEIKKVLESLEHNLADPAIAGDHEKITALSIDHQKFTDQYEAIETQYEQAFDKVLKAEEALNKYN